MYTIGIIADDLTGANDTALQFHLRGCNTQILFDYTQQPEGIQNTGAWAISTESRNIESKQAYEKVLEVTKALKSTYKVEYFYKKIDSTLRGNIAKEILASLVTLDMDAALIAPAFPTEGRTTVGGYQLLKGIPIERTEIARDPHAPIYESHIPTLLKSQIETPEIVGLIELNTIMKGAGPILIKLQELIKAGKRLIIADSISTTDMEQIALAIEKCQANILPCGSAGLAQALSKHWLPEMKHKNISKTIPDLPVLIVSGSKTDLTRLQVEKLADSDEFEPYFLTVTEDMVVNDVLDEELIGRVVSSLISVKKVVIHCKIDVNLENKHNESELSHQITDYLAELTKKIVNRIDVILVLIGGETSFKCCSAIDTKTMHIIDETAPAIPLCIDHKAQWIVTKSGNLGSPNTLVDILKYFEMHK